MNTLKPNDKFINGDWYEDQYSTPGSRYHDCYIRDPFVIQAQETNWYYSLLIAATLGVRPEDKILDLGSGVGKYIETWMSNGYNNIQGIEISKTAISHSSVKDRITHGSVADLSMFEDKEFDLVFSSAFFEHVDESILATALKECDRVGKNQAHLIDLPGKVDQGDIETDPSHITMKPMDEWMELFNKYSEGMIMRIDDLLTGEWPILAVLDTKRLHYPVIRNLYKAQKKRKAQMPEQREYSAIQLR
jgi:ubiquinone/menaquinone biosynthesis C-methylase UbiE